LGSFRGKESSSAAKKGRIGKKKLKKEGLAMKEQHLKPDHEKDPQPKRTGRLPVMGNSQI